MTPERVRRFGHLAGALVAVVSPGSLAGQTVSNPDSVLANEKRLMITPFLAPGYTPEMGALLTVGGLISYRTAPAIKPGTLNELVQRSTLTLNGSISTTGALTGNADLSSYWRGDQLRVFLKFAVKDMPDDYWGVGFDAGKAPEGDSTTAYQRISWAFMPRILLRVASKLLVGPVLDLNSTQASEVSPGVADDPYFTAYGPDNQNSGGGAIVQYDTRDVAANAWKGLFLNAQAVFYGGVLGGDNSYQVYDLEYRQYRQMGRDGRTLAWTVRTRFTGGSVPWAELSQLGGSNDLRGYRTGRYRDKAMLYGIVEYRYQFQSEGRTTGLSRHGLVGWVGAGSVGEDLGQLTQWLPNWGVGYRLEVQPRMSVRADVGFGREYLQAGNKFVPSVYFSFTEAF